MTEFDQREELHAAIGYKMMRASINGNAGGSNPPKVGSNPTPAAIYINADTGEEVAEDWWP